MQNPFYQPLISDFESLATPMREALCIGVPVIEPCSFFQSKGLDLAVDVLRLDAVHPIISGNKWYKLKFNLAQAKAAGASELLSFGGPWSNHLHALAFAAKQLDIKLNVIIRGEEWRDKPNALLADLQSWGAQLSFVSRQTYRRRNSADYLHKLAAKSPNIYLIPEGADNFLGFLGIGTVFNQLAGDCAERLLAAHSVAIACGTGNSLIGIRQALPSSKRVLGVSALKGDWYEASIQQKMWRYWPLPTGKLQVFSDYHGGGFGKLSPEVKDFVHEFETSTQLLLDPIYTAKLFYGVYQLAQHGYFPPGHRLLLVHSGGLQGRRSPLLDS